jgi:hypothetical protein
LYGIRTRKPGEGQPERTSGTIQLKRAYERAQ